METLSNKLDQIELKLRQLALKIERLEGANAALLEENQQLKAENNKGGSQNSDLEMRLAKAEQALEIKRAEDPEESKKIRKEIDRYIKEIDKCIEWLNAS